MTQQVKQGLPAVPRLQDHALLRFLQALRAAQNELQALSRLFKGLTASQVKNLLAGLDRLAKTERTLEQQLSTTTGQKALIAQHEQTIKELQQQLTQASQTIQTQQAALDQLLERVNTLEASYEQAVSKSKP